MQRAVLASAAALLGLAGSVPSFGQEAPVAGDQSGAAPASVPAELRLSASQIDTLTGPIALYPDPLIAQILPASTYPTDIVLAARLLAKGATEAELQAQPWDPAVKSLTNYPSIIKMMDERLSWTQSLGAAFLQQPDDVMDSIQRMRAKARALGHLVDTPQQRVIVEEEPETTVIRVVPASSTVVYVPTYEPRVVYAYPYTASFVSSPYVSFGVGFAIGSWLDLDCDWYGRRCYYPVGWTWSTCGTWGYRNWCRPSYFSSYWCGPTWSVSIGWGSPYRWSSGWCSPYYGGYYGYRYVGHHRHWDGGRYNHSYNPYGRTTDVAYRSYEARRSYPSGAVAARSSDAREWRRDAGKSSLYEGSRHVSAGSDLYKRSSPSGIQDRYSNSPSGTRLRTADDIKRDLASRSTYRRDASGKVTVPGTTGRSTDSFKRDTTGRSTGSRPDITVPRSASPRTTTSPGNDTYKRSAPSTGSRSTGVRVPETRVRTVGPTRTTTRSSPGTTTRSPGVQRSTGPTTRQVSPAKQSSGGRNGLQRATPSGGRSSPATRSSGGGGSGGSKSGGGGSTTKRSK